MATTTVPSGSTNQGLPVTSGNGVDVLSGATLLAATIEAGSVAVTSGGTSPVLSGPAGTLTVSAGAIIEAGGSDSQSQVQAGAVELVLGSASGDTIAGIQFVSGGTAAVSNETVVNGGSVDIYVKGAVAANITVQSGGALNLSGNVTATNTVLSGGTLAIQSPKATLSGTLTLVAGTDNTILVTAGQSASAGTFQDEAAPIAGFTTGDVIDDQALAFGGTLALTSAASGNNELVSITSGGTVVETFDFAAGTNIAAMTLAADASGNAEILPCFCPGTLILTDEGEKAVEDLRVGDGVVTTAGAVEPIRWIGRRSYAGRALAGRRHLLPIRIKAGALSDATPRRDLLLSPLHAMLIDGLLVPAHMLVNGASIVQEPAVPSVDYIHIELDRHDTIWAEGAATETFVDDDGRFAFATSEGAPVERPGAAIYCAPRVEEGYELEALRQRLATRTASPVVQVG